MTKLTATTHPVECESGVVECSILAVEHRGRRYQVVSHRLDGSVVAMDMDSGEFQEWDHLLGDE